MAKQLKTFDFTMTGNRKYPWNEWMNGKPWRIVRGEDYEGPDEGMRSTLYIRATRAGIKVKVAKVEDGALVFQFVDAR